MGKIIQKWFILCWKAGVWFSFLWNCLNSPNKHTSSRCRSCVCVLCVYPIIMHIIPNHTCSTKALGHARDYRWCGATEENWTAQYFDKQITEDPGNTTKGITFTKTSQARTVCIMTISVTSRQSNHLNMLSGEAQKHCEATVFLAQTSHGLVSLMQPCPW